MEIHNQEKMTLNEMKLILQFDFTNEKMFKVINCLYYLDWRTLIELKKYISSKITELIEHIIFNNVNNNISKINLEKYCKIEESIINIIKNYIISKNL